MLAAIVATVAFTQLSGPALLDDLSQRSFQFFWNETNAANGLTKDRAGNFAADSYTIASIASSGYALAADAIGAERGYVPRDQALARAKAALSFLSSTKAAKAHGWFYHFVDYSTGARAWSSEASTIDTAILVAGAVMASEFFKDPVLDLYLQRIVSAIDWNWMLTDDGTNTSHQFSLSWTPEHGFNSFRWTTLSEQTILYIEALGASSATPADVWTKVNRPLITYAGRNEIQGGPLFMHELSQGFLPLYGRRDSLGFDYTVEERNAVANARQYCIDNPNHRAGYATNIWGLSAGDSPTGYEACGGPGWGVDDGTLNPAIAIAGVQYDYADGQIVANSYLAKYPKAYGRYGFSNTINPGANWIDQDVIGVDLGTMLLGIENWRTGLPEALCGGNPMIQAGMQRAGFHATAEGYFSTRALVVQPSAP